MKEKYKQQLSTAASEILEHSGLSFALMGDKMAVSPSEKAVKLLKARPAEMLRAESYSRAANYHKASAGRKAVERILDGEDWKKAISDMEAEWDAAVSEHMWD
jgi:hypothetical protein